jgi:hypothetical protein
MLRRAFFSLAVLMASIMATSEANAQVPVSGHYRHNAYGGLSYVRPHYRTHADTSFYNNWSTYPNINPYTGAIGTHHRPSYGYGSSYGTARSSSSSGWRSWFGW